MTEKPMFMLTKTGIASPNEVDRLRELWTDGPRWYVRLWMFVHRWHIKKVAP